MYQSSTATLKQLTEWSKDEPHWMSWLSEHCVDHDLLNYLLIFFSCKMLCNRLLKRSEKEKQKRPFPRGAFSAGHGHVHAEQLVNTHSIQIIVLLPYHPFEWLTDTESGFRRSGWRGEDYVSKSPALPNPSSVHWNFKKAQTARALGCLSSHCLLNHWRAIGLSMHEKVLSAGTLQNALKKPQHPNK